MNHIAVVYWSGTGNTEQMAQAVLEGAKESGASSECFSADEFDGTMMDNYDRIAFGCPAMGAEELEEGEFQPILQAEAGGEENCSVWFLWLGRWRMDAKLGEFLQSRRSASGF